MAIKQKVRDFKRELILEEAGKLFIEEGYDTMKIADLAKNVGVSVGTIYNLFGSKENLYNHYIMDLVEHALETVETAMQQLSDPVERLREITRIKFTLLTKHKNALKESINDPSFFLHVSADRDDPFMRFYFYMAQEVMQPLVQQYDSPTDPMEMVFLYDGLSFGVMKHWLVCGGDLQSRIDPMVDRFINLIRNPS